MTHGVADLIGGLCRAFVGAQSRGVIETLHKTVLIVMLKHPRHAIHDTIGQALCFRHNQTAISYRGAKNPPRFSDGRMR